MLILRFHIRMIGGMIEYCLAFYCSFKKYRQPKSLEKIKLYLTDSVRQKTRHCMAEFSAQGLTGLKSRYLVLFRAQDPLPSSLILAKFISLSCRVLAVGGDHYQLCRLPTTLCYVAQKAGDKRDIC